MLNKVFFLLVIFSNSLFAQEFEVLFSSEKINGGCYRIPAIATAINGNILVAVDERIPNCSDLRGNDDINIVLRTSEDNGESWNNEVRIVDFPLGISASDPSFIVDHITGGVFLFYNYMDLNKAPDIYRFQYIKSLDHGKTWSEPVDITAEITEAAWEKDFMFITSGRGIQTLDEKLLHTLVNLERGVFIFGSEDHGDSWKLFGEAITPADESKIIELSDGRWMVNSRVNKAGLRYVHLSDDEGKTWSTLADSSLMDPSCNGSIIKYSGDTLYFSNPSSVNKRENLVIRKSLDSGRNWDEGEVIYKGSAAYSTMSILDNGNIGVVFEKDDYNEIVFYSYNR